MNLSFGKVWDRSEFSVAHGPEVIGRVPDRYLFKKDTLRVLDMPIKFPDTEIRLPNVLWQFKETIEICTTHSDGIVDPTLYYIYLTADQGIVNAFQTQRTPGVHVDGFQGPRINPKVVASHSYLVSNTLPTKFYVQPFDLVNLDDNVHNFFKAMGEQTKSKYTYQPDPYDIVVLDSYCAHRAVYSPEFTERTFFRLEYCVRKYDRKGNTHNSLFKYRWRMVPRPIPEHLI